MRKTIIGAVVAASAAAAFTPLGIANAADTTLNITITSTGGILLSAPESATLGTGDITTGSLSGTFSNTVGPVAVTDNRGRLANAWSVGVTLTDWHLTTASNTDADVPATATTYVTGAPTTTGIVVPVPLVGIGALSGILPVGAMTATGVGNNSVTWNPTVAVPQAQFSVAGTYQSTLTQSLTVIS